LFLNTFLNYLKEKSIVYYKEFDELVKNILTVNFSTDKNYTKYNLIIITEFIEIINVFMKMNALEFQLQNYSNEI
jgi:hypothetical protein